MLKQFIVQYPIISLLVTLIFLGGVLWASLYSLLVKPRDKRILELEKDITRFRNGFIKVSKRERLSKQSKDQTHGPNVSSNPEISIRNGQSQLEERRSNNILNVLVLDNLQKLLNIWNDKNLTELQKTHVEEIYTGQYVSWEVLVISIADEKDKKIRVTITPPSSKFNIDTAQAIFDASSKDDLLCIKKGEPVMISGTIERFFLSPVLQNCTLKSIQNYRAIK